MELFELTKQLIDIPSVTGEEKNAGTFLAALLEGLGYSVERQEVSEDRFNVIAHTEATPSVVFSTHIDTVPPFIASREDDGRIYGRGACDAKGIIAAQVFAAERLRAGGESRIGLLFTVDEESGSLGARVANHHSLARHCEFLINGEPTDNKLAMATKGSLRLSLKTNGRACHSAYPEHGDSAVEKLLDVLNDIRQSDWPIDDVLGETTCNIGVIAGGTRPNVIPAEASAVLQLRLVTNAEQIKRRLEETVAGRAEIEYLSENDPVHLFTVGSHDQQAVRFTTDIPYLLNWGSPLLVGPGSILNAHSDHEFVEKQELTEAVDLYATLAERLLESVPAMESSDVAEGAAK